MTGIIIVTHGPLSKALLESTKLIIGEVEDVYTIGLFHGDSTDDLKNRIKDNINKFNDVDGILIFTDLFGGTPNNMTALAINELGNLDDIRCFVGVNLPVLLEAISMRKAYEFKDLVVHIKSIAKDSIFELSERLGI